MLIRIYATEIVHIVVYDCGLSNKRVTADNMDATARIARNDTLIDERAGPVTCNRGATDTTDVTATNYCQAAQNGIRILAFIEEKLINIGLSKKDARVFSKLSHACSVGLFSIGSSLKGRDQNNINAMLVNMIRHLKKSA